MDQGARLVRRARLTPANVNETLVADELILGDEAAVHADKGYDTAERRAMPSARGIADGIMRRGHLRRPLTPAETARNRTLTPIRAAIEPVFGTRKRSYRWARARYRGLARNAAHLDLPCLALTLRRADVPTR